MDLDKIFIKNCSPTRIGGQAVMEGLMMRGTDRTAVAVRKPNGDIHVREKKLADPKKWMKWPIIRGIFAFIDSLVTGTGTLMYSAEVLEQTMDDEEEYTPSKFENWFGSKFGEKALFNLLIYVSVIIALVFSIGIFVLLPTFAVGWLKKYIENVVVLNLIEGVLRIVMFIIYIAAISRMKDIQRVFEYHGAEHETIHCYENGLELKPENCQIFGTLHPRCGTSFLMFVMVISLLLFSFLGWPSVVWRVLSRLLLIPVVAGLSYELLRWAGRSTSPIVKILSIPGLLLQKLTTRTPDDEELEVAIAAMNAVLKDRPAEDRIYAIHNGEEIPETDVVAKEGR